MSSGVDSPDPTSPATSLTLEQQAPATNSGNDSESGDAISSTTSSDIYGASIGPYNTLPGTSDRDTNFEPENDADMSDDGGASLDLSPPVPDVSAQISDSDGEIMEANNTNTIAVAIPIDVALDELNYTESLHHLPSQGNALMVVDNDAENGIEDDTDVTPEDIMTLADLTSGMNHVTAHLQDLQGQQVDDGDGAQIAHTGMITADMENQRNLSLGDFLFTWAMVDAHCLSNTKKRKRTPNVEYLEELREGKKIKEIKRSDLRNGKCDFQGINWDKLEVSRTEGRMVRQKTYRSFLNKPPAKYYTDSLRQHRIDESQNYFQFRRMDLTQKPHYAHFQLRNLVACTSQNSVYYSGHSKIYQSRPLFRQKHLKLDLTDPYVQSANPDANGDTGILITTLAANHGILIAGGFGGEYALSSTTTMSKGHTEGLITEHGNSITNHIDLIQNRHSSTPQAIISSNDYYIRVLDTETEKFVHEKCFNFSPNCSATSPDSRLRVMVGDKRNVYILNAETSQVLHKLSGHTDYGFACAWADNGYHVATGNQDKMVRIWDARMWTDSNGKGKVLKTVSSELTAIRSLKFSPVGSGKRVLVAAEQADIINIIDAETYDTKQTLDFYGEILGTSFSPDGQGLFVGVNDPLRGGVMEFERCGKGESYGNRRYRYDKTWGGYEEADQIDEKWVSGDEGQLVSTSPADPYEHMDAGLDWKRTVEESVTHRKAKRTATWYRRNAAGAGDELPFY